MTGSGAIVSGLHATVAGYETKATAVELDFDSNGNVIYFGIADPGSNVNNPIWQIKQLNYSGTGNLLSILWANGKPTFENIWTNRAALSYS